MNPNTLSLIRAVPALGALLLAVPVWAAFTVNSDGTVTDTVTDLVWDRCTWGQTGADCSGSASTHTWQAALGVAVTANAMNSGAGYKDYNDWRLPSKNELESLVDSSTFNPAIDTAAFPNPYNYYWTSTTRGPAPADAWYVYFFDGLTFAGIKGYDFHVRLVRSGQSFDDFDLLNIVPTPNRDHYQCYQTKLAKGSDFQSLTVDLVDQFEQRLTTVVKPKALCNPADKNGEGIADPLTHLMVYQIQNAKVCADTGLVCANNKDCAAGTACAAPKSTSYAVRVSNQVGTLLLETQKPTQLLVPSAKSLSGPADPADLDASTVDHFKCYDIKVNKNRCEGDSTLKCNSDADCASAGPCNFGFLKGTTVTVKDQFTDQSKAFEMKAPTRLCNPVNKDGEGIQDPDNHLLCYPVKPVKGEPVHVKRSGVNLDNQFGSLVLDTVKEEDLCVPTQKTLFSAPTAGAP
jgi:hypothetical protein